MKIVIALEFVLQKNLSLEEKIRNILENRSL